jgi:LPXTG-site transpeptidase (sortase) family protein
VPTGSDEPPVEPADGIESFLSAVRGMVHGDEEVAPPQSATVAEAADGSATAAASPEEWVADDGQPDWLPGTWVVDAPTTPRRRADRRADKSLAKQEKKLRDAERRNASRAQKRRRSTPDEQPVREDAEAPAGRIPAQPGPTIGDRPDEADRRRRRRRRQEDARASAALDGEHDAELVPSGPAATVETTPGESRRRSRRGRAVGGEGKQSGDSPAAPGGLSDTSSMSTVDTDPVRPGAGGVADEPPPAQGDEALSRSARRAERRRVREERRRQRRAAAVRELLAAEAARAARIEASRQAKVDKRDRRVDAKLARKAAAAARRERRAEDTGTRGEVDAPTEPVGAVVDGVLDGVVDEGAAAEPVDQPPSVEEGTSGGPGRAATRAARKAARGVARAEQGADRQADAAEEKRRRAEVRAAAERGRLEARLARLEARATARADKDARRLAEVAAKADAKAKAEADALDRRQDRRARRIEKRRATADAKTAQEIADLERRRERRAARLEKVESRARTKAREEAARLEQQRDEIARSSLDGLDHGRTDAIGSGRTDESLGEYLGRVESSILPWRSRRSRVPVRVRRTARIVGVCVLIGGAAVVPWAAPQVAGVIGDALPGGGHVATTKDPPVEPPARGVAGPVGIATETNPLEGKRLVAAGWPRRVQVPRLHVDSTVVPISGQSGALLPPDDPQVLGWWREGKPVGGEFGSAVITGHTVHTGGGALDNLAKLAVGDTIRTQTDDGWITYVVQRTRIYSTEELARDATDVFRLSGPGRLVMITCDDWNGSFYESNAVVFATPTSDDPFEGEGVGHVPDPGTGATP